MAKKLADFVQQHERNVQKKEYGYPVSFITELIDLALRINLEKKKWQRLAKDRKDVINKIKHITLLESLTPEPEDNSNGSE